MSKTPSVRHKLQLRPRFKGNILAYASITLNTGATPDGGALARTGAATLDTNPIVVPELPAILILPLFMIATLLAVIVYKKRNLG